MPNGIGIRAPDTSLEPIDAIGISGPVDSTGLQAWAILNSYTSPTTNDAAKVLRNFAKGKPNFVAVGAPVIDATSTRFTALSNYLQTDITDTTDFTFFIVCKSDDTQAAGATRAVFFATDTNSAVGGGGTTWGVNLRAASSSSVVLTAGRGTAGSSTASSATITGHNFASWSLILGRVNGDVTELHNVTQGLQGSVTVASPRLLGVERYRIGSGQSFNAGRSDIRDVAHFSRALSDAEVALMIADIRAKCAARGIIV